MFGVAVFVLAVGIALVVEVALVVVKTYVAEVHFQMKVARQMIFD